MWVHVSVLAKDGDHSRAIRYPADRWTGVYHTDHTARPHTKTPDHMEGGLEGYISVKRSTCNDSSWVQSEQVEDAVMGVGKKSTRTTGKSPTTVNCSSSDKQITKREIEIVNTYYKPFSSLKEANSISQLKEIGSNTAFW